MVTIEINNSYSQIIGLKTEEFHALRKILSYETDPSAVYFSGGWNRKKYLIDKQGFFPTGLIAKVLLFATDLGKVKISERRKQPTNSNRIFKFKDMVKPYKWQSDATDKAQLHGRGGIVAPTGTGKSLVIAVIASKLQVRTLIVVPTLEIKKQLSNSLIYLFGENKNIVVENIDSSALKRLKDFDCLIIDECHHAAAKTYQDLNKHVWTGIYYRFFLTATFFRNQENEQLLFEGIAGEPIYQLTQKEAVKKGYIVPIEAYYQELPKMPTEAYTWREVYNDLVVNNDYRNGVISGYLVGLNAEMKATLCLVKEIKHGEILSSITGFPFANGKDESSREYIEDFKLGEIKVLIATTGVCGEGIDTKPAEYIIIAGLGKAKSAFMQWVGRIVRNYEGKKTGKVILFRDKSHKFLLRHFNAQAKILLEEYEVKVEKL